MATVRFSPDKADHANVLDYDGEAAGVGDVTGLAGRLTGPDGVLDHTVGPDHRPEGVGRPRPRRSWW